MKLVAKCSASLSLPDQVHVKVCNPIPLSDPYFLDRQVGQTVQTQIRLLLEEQFDQV